MKIKHKGKVHPSPSSSSSTPSSYLISCSSARDALSVLKLLPAAILALASVLSLEDREVLAYMITRSMRTTTTGTTSSSSSLVNDSKKKCNKKPSSSNCNNNGAIHNHKPPLFDCECFDCYTCYWFRWDSSPNRELIHQAIEAFEDHLAHGEQSKKTNARGKRKEKPSRRTVEKPADAPGMAPPKVEAEVSDSFSPETTENTADLLTPEEYETSQAVGDGVEISDEAVVMDGYLEAAEVAEKAGAAVLRNTAANEHKGLARKVLPDVLGLFNSRLWNLWGPNV